MSNMEYVRAEAVRWVDEEWPGWIEVQIAEYDGTVAVFVDKVPIFDYGDQVVPGVAFPVQLEVPCELLRWEAALGRRVAVIVLGDTIEDRAGRTVFRVDERQIVTSS